mmetsp:Transcript_43420/g.108849  ORF Transcript_43420/g.108849 Transcript_43420/m.108849 type:complete len:365 (+) Transcript_43420:174-1268(+)
MRSSPTAPPFSTSSLLLAFVAGTALVAPCCSFSSIHFPSSRPPAPSLRQGSSSPARLSAPNPLPPSLLPPQLRRPVAGVALNLDYVPGLGETEVAYDHQDGGQEFDEEYSKELFGPTPDEVDRKRIILDGQEGLPLFETFKNHLNQHHEELLRGIAVALHDPEKEPWINADGDTKVQHAEVIALDCRGFDISVSVCDDASCWLAVVHARYPDKSVSASSLFESFDTIVDRCLCDKPRRDGICKVDKEILPEVYTSITSILNKDFLVEVNRTVTHLSGVKSQDGEYISRIAVDTVTQDGFVANVYFCNYVTQCCSFMTVKIKFARSAADAADMEQQLAQCLEDGSCHLSDISIEVPDAGFERFTS